MSAGNQKNSNAVGVLPAYQVRASRRAKRIGLRVLPGKGLEVVLPPHADPLCVPGILLRYRSWIDKTLARMQSFRPPEEKEQDEDARTRGGPDRKVPRRLSLKGGSEVIEISPWGCPSLPGAGALVLPRNLDLDAQKDAESALLFLREWVREEARRYLGGMLAALAREHGFSYSSLSVRFQRTRWGSCSVKRGISVNACLLFLPEHLTRHILLHELCHTRQMNHSREFWKLLFALEPEALALDRSMRGAWRFVPGWIFSSRTG